MSFVANLHDCLSLNLLNAKYPHLKVHLKTIKLCVCSLIRVNFTFIYLFSKAVLNKEYVYISDFPLGMKWLPINDNMNTSQTHCANYIISCKPVCYWHTIVLGLIYNHTPMNTSTSLVSATIHAGTKLWPFQEVGKEGKKVPVLSVYYHNKHSVFVWSSTLLWASVTAEVQLTGVQTLGEMSDRWKKHMPTTKTRN